MIIKTKLQNKKILTITILIFLFLINLSIEYAKYLDLIDEEIYETKVEVLNIYKKDNFDILRVKADNFDFFTNVNKNENIKKSDFLNITFISRNISFLDYLKGFYTKTIYQHLMLHNLMKLILQSLKSSELSKMRKQKISNFHLLYL